MTADADASSTLATALLAAAQAAGIAAVEVQGLKRLSGGASKESWAFDVHCADGTHMPLVLRRQPAALRFSHTGLASLQDEADLLRAVIRDGVPVPHVAFTLPAGSAAGEGYAMARMEGETVGMRILKDPSLAQARTQMAAQCGTILARLHQVDYTHLKGLKPATPAQALKALWKRLEATGQERPVFVYALHWLAENLPSCDRLTLVHGDFRNGNIIVTPQGISAVLDWELAHIGAPASDLAWLCVTSWRFQVPELPVGGFGTRAQLLEAYQAAGGAPIDAAELHAWEVFQTLNWGLMCAEVGTTFMQGTRSVEGAMIAHRASETEFDLMRLLLPDHEAWHAR